MREVHPDTPITLSLRERSEPNSQPRRGDLTVAQGKGAKRLPPWVTRPQNPFYPLPSEGRGLGRGVHLVVTLCDLCVLLRPLLRLRLRRSARVASLRFTCPSAIGYRLFLGRQSPPVFPLRPLFLISEPALTRARRRSLH